MKALAVLWVLAGVLVSALPASAEKATQGEALALAKDWVALIIANSGSWGGQPAAQVTGIQGLKRHGQLLGFFCPVSPKGYVIVSLYKELAAVKAFSDTSNLDPASDEGMADLIKGGMERQIGWAEAKLGKKLDAAQPRDIGRVLEINYRKQWDEIESGAATSTSPSPTGESVGAAQSPVLLTSVWHQNEPYNNQCPYMSCTQTTNGRAWVGCVATAGAQIMHYWAWPPNGSGGTPYDWPNMPDDCNAGSPQVQKDAVARLCHEIGTMVNMSYGCGESSALISSEPPLYNQHTPYNRGVGILYRKDNDANTWFNKFRDQISMNQPVQYNVVGHSVVGDGWMIGGNNNEYHWYHMNYGWNDSYTTWYAVDALYLGNPDAESMVVDIVPQPSLFAMLVGTYDPATSPYPPYRYVSENVFGSGVTFNAGHRIQFLPGTNVKGTGSDGVSINSTSGNSTRLFARGDMSKGMALTGGAIKLTNDGEVTLK